MLGVAKLDDISLARDVRTGEDGSMNDGDRESLSRRGIVRRVSYFFTKSIEGDAFLPFWFAFGMPVSSRAVA